MNYKNFLQKKVDLAREQIQAGQYRSNEGAAAAFAELRGFLLAGYASAPTKAVGPGYFKKLRARVANKKPPVKY